MRRRCDGIEILSRAVSSVRESVHISDKTSSDFMLKTRPGHAWQGDGGKRHAAYIITILRMDCD